MKTISRRHVLRGAGGFTLALPFLPSLAPRALGEPLVARPRRFLAMTTEHGGLAPENMYPADAVATERRELLPGHEIRWGRMPRVVEGASASFSPLLRAPATLLTETLAAKMNVMRGLDIPFYINHHTGGHLGNYARNNGNLEPGKNFGGPFIPTIDQVMAWSRAFYPDLSGIKERSLVTGNNGQISWGWSNPAARSGVVQRMESVSSAQSLFDRLFVPKKTAAGTNRRPIVDLVFESYKGMHDGNRRLSASDKQRLTDHMDRLSELQRRLLVQRDCGVVQRPAGEPAGADPVTRARANFASTIDVIAAAMVCDLTRIAVVGVGSTFSNFGGDWHQDIAHKSRSSIEAQETLVASYRETFAAVFLALASRLDVEETQGRTYLDNSLLVWTQESGAWTHDSDSIPVVTAGSAGGYLKTGLYVDYRNMAMPYRLRESDGKYLPGRNTGVTFNRWLGTALHAMGVPRPEWERPDAYGYGNNFIDSRYRGKYAPGVVESAYDPLPVVA